MAGEVAICSLATNPRGTFGLERSETEGGQSLQVEISPMSGLHVSNSLSTYVTIIKRADRSTWSLVANRGADGDCETYEGFASDADAWRYFCDLK